MESRRSPWSYLVFAFVAALLALLVYGVAIKAGGNSYDNALAAGKRLPATVREARVLNDDDTMSIADFRGKVVVLNFWASWCVPCREEAPAIERAYAKYAPDGLVVIGANVDDLTSAANKFVIDYKLTYPSLRYSSENATKDFGTKRLPETFIIDRNGSVAALQRFQVDDAWLNKVIPPVLNEKRVAAS
ncbi:MAG: TlpA family protein disulfide reductase [Solirubrobacterales bacterium]|nr:TlpA family protein disulfide reductase [Solirubrobacterales bacterium]